MKLSTKPISSPGRTDKFPPQLMRFLRSNAGSRSRRSRSSPMFVRKKNNTTIETQEPSSPKVTCMGQVRVKRSSKQAATKRDCRCWSIRRPHLCHCPPLWPNWPFFRKKSTKLKTDSTKSESNFHYEEEEEEEEERVNVSANNNNNKSNNNVFASSNSCTPPSNALLLTRCRSAPYRSSSLAGRFWGSEETEVANAESNESVGPTSMRHSNSYQEGKRVPETETKLGFFKKLEDSLRERMASITASESVEELSKSSEVERDSESRPVVLTRCKSEPARTGHRLDPEVNNLWKKRRLGFD